MNLLKFLMKNFVLVNIVLQLEEYQIVKKLIFKMNFCNKNHFSNKCLSVTDREIRKNMLRKQGRCFICMERGHISKNCKVSYKCVKCNGNHNVSICNSSSKYKRKKEYLNDSKPKETITNHVNCSQQTILLQTATALTKNMNDKKKVLSRLLFDCCSQRTYCTETLRKKLNFKVLRQETVLMKRFASDQGVLKTVDVVHICVRGKTKSGYIYIEALCLPFLCSPLQNQDLKLTLKTYPYFKNLQLAENDLTGNNHEIDILVGMDNYYKFMTSRIIRKYVNGPVALESNLGWVICGSTSMTVKRSDVEPLTPSPLTVGRRLLSQVGSVNTEDPDS
ncbi:uncharacterized protein LOC124815319 [Hydra vulgaris]|uniref:uncharacterized protein LOC124815319 n=1 Tax=Hydra vulgaris TaxID=6087 RepID=UPI0032EA1B20